MDAVKNLCRNMRDVPHIMSFSDIGQAIAKGAAMGQKVHDPFAGAVLNLSLEAGRRVLRLSEDLWQEIETRHPGRIEPPK